MSIKEITITNFKSIKDLSLKLKSINVFFGQPNSGKSNILESLGLISALTYNRYASLHGKTYFSQSFVRHEHIMNLFYENNIDKQIIIDIDDLRFIIESTESGYFFSSMDKKNGGSKQRLIEFREDGSASHGSRDKIPPIARNIKFYRFRLRPDFPYKHTHFLLPPDGGNLTTIIQSDTQLREIIYNLLLPFELELNIRIEENKVEFLRQIEFGRISIPFSLAAETIQRLIFLLAIIVSNKNSTIVLEEPETHLFPYYTKFLAETIAMRMDKNANQYLISTHNPYFLTTLLEKTKTERIALFAVRYKKNKTEVCKLSKKEIEDMLYYQEDPFFNIDGYFK